jgi:hypothetical protein
MNFDDYLAIKNLIHRYPQCTDKGDFEGEWRFTHRAEDMELIGDLSAHLLRDMTV